MFLDVSGFEATIDGREIVAEVKEKHEAKREYNQAMKEGQTAILMNEVSPDIFSMSLGQLKPGSKAIIKMTYMMELPVENGMTRLTIPTTIAPRYRPKDCQNEAANLDINYNDGSSVSIRISPIAILFS